MKGFKSYFHPADKKGVSTPISNVEMADSPLPSATPSYPGTGTATPRYSGSRPVSLFPNGDFRNSAQEDIMEIKADVMVNWLHQQQMERMWTNGAIGEGVVLKKSRDAYTSCPAELSTYQEDFFDAVCKLNVRVRQSSSLRPSIGKLT